MRTDIQCMECFLRQAASVARRSGADAGTAERVIKNTLALLSRADHVQSPPSIAEKMYKLINSMTGNGDPYLAEKQMFNAVAMAMLPRLRDVINNSEDPFETAVRLAIAGNIIDFGILDVDEKKVEETVAASLNGSLDCAAVDALERGVAGAKKILYLCDNAGEIAFDRLLVERLPREKVTAVVKGGPIINDALIADAVEVGLCELVEVIDNGSAAPGTLPELCSDEFRRRFGEADLIISKGQGNFETLEGMVRNIFYLFTVKCNVVAEYVGNPLGSSMVMYGCKPDRNLQQSRVSAADTGKL